MAAAWRAAQRIRAKGWRGRAAGHGRPAERDCDVGEASAPRCSARRQQTARRGEGCLVAGAAGEAVRCGVVQAGADWRAGPLGAPKGRRRAALAAAAPSAEECRRRRPCPILESAGRPAHQPPLQWCSGCRRQALFHGCCAVGGGRNRLRASSCRVGKCLSVVWAPSTRVVSSAAAPIDVDKPSYQGSENCTPPRGAAPPPIASPHGARRACRRRPAGAATVCATRPPSSGRSHWRHTHGSEACKSLKAECGPK